MKTSLSDQLEQHAITRQVADAAREDQREFSALDKAVEFGGYLATAVDTYLSAVDAFGLACETDPHEVHQGLEDAITDCRRSMVSAVYEFRKRAERAKAPAPQKHP